MGGSIIDLIIAVMLGGAGIYGIISSLRLKKEGYLFENKLLYPGNCKPEECEDVEGFIDYIVQRMILFGVMCVVLAVATVLLSYLVVSLSALTVEVATVVVVFAYIGVVQNKASKLFW